MIREFKERDFFYLLHHEIQQSKDDKKHPGYQKERFRVEVPEACLCVLCEEVANRPFECELCRSLTCKNCLEKNLRFYFLSVKKFVCASCKHIVPLKEANTELKQQIGELELKCKYPECQEYMKLGIIDTHEKSCPLKTLKCLRRQCDTIGILNNFYRFYLYITPWSSRKTELFTCSRRCYKLLKVERNIGFRQKSEIMKSYFSLLSKLTS